MNKRGLIIVVAIVTGIVGMCCWTVVRHTGDGTREQRRAAYTFRENLAREAAEAWGKRNIRIDSRRGPEDALALVLQAAEGSCTEPAIHLFILNTFGYIERVETITCNEKNKSITVPVRPYLDLIRETFPMVPRALDTKIEFGGTVTKMGSYHGWYEKTRFESRQALIDHLQIEPREYEFATPSAALHERGFRLYAAEHDDRILVVETVACDMLEYRGIHFSSLGSSRTTAVKWTELGGTFMV